MNPLAATLISTALDHLTGDKGESKTPAEREAWIQLLIAEITTKTVPWVDALHKMGRQIQWYLFTFLVLVNEPLGLGITDAQFGMIAGLGGVYQWKKGVGSPVIEAFGGAVEAIRNKVKKGPRK